MSRFSRNFLSGLSTAQIKKEIKRREKERLERKDHERREEVGASMYHLRDRDMGEMSPLLRSLIDAYRPHTWPDWESLTPLPERDSFIEELAEAA